MTARKATVNKRRVSKAAGPAFGLRGVMLDMARVVERKEYYTLLLPWLAEWGYNFVHLHLIDDQRCALKFPSHPELASKGAFTPEEMREFVELAGSLGIAVMPEIEALGHARLIFEHRGHRVLKEPTPKGAALCDFNSMCPAHPGTRKLLSELLADVVDIFDYPVIHLGLDEVQLGNCPRCRRKFGASSPDWKRYAEHAKWVQAEVRRLGRRPAMWADHIVHSYDDGYSADIIKGMKRDVLMFQWDYNADFKEKRSADLLDAGFEVVACPALSKSGTVFAPYSENLTNIRRAASRSLPQKKRGLLGLVNTVWCPWRYLPGVLDYGLALAGHVFSAQEEDVDLAMKFAARFYGLTSGKTVGGAMVELCSSGLDQRLYQRIAQGRDGSRSVFGRDDVRECRLLAAKMKAVVATLKKERSRVKRNRDRYDDCILAAESIRAFATFGVRGRKRGVPGARALLKRVEKAWARDRYPGDRMRLYGGVRQSMILCLRMIS
jgi:Glycosyl hydrolase family 20, catalytic domain